jgi:hypothetical protein
MSGNNPLSALTSSTSSLFNAAQSVASTSLFNRIDWVFRLGVVAATLYCLDNLYRAYQLWQHKSFALDDRFKLAKCHALYAKAQEENQPSLLKQCEDLLVSIIHKGVFKDEEKLFLKLAQHYAKTEPEHSYQLAQQLKSADHIFEAALSLKNAEFPDIERLDALFMQAFNKLAEKQSTGFSWLLQFAKAFSPNHPRFEGFLAGCVLSLDLELEQPDIKNFPLFKFRAYCQIAQCHYEIGNPTLAESSIESAQKLLNDKIIDVEKIEARLILADTFFSVGNIAKMAEELTKALTLMGSYSYSTDHDLYFLAKLVNKFEKKDHLTPTVESLIEKTLNFVLKDEFFNVGRARIGLKIASIYQEGLLQETSTKQKALEMAYTDIQSLPEDKDAYLLQFLSSFYENDGVKTREIGRKLEGFYSLSDKNLSLGKAILKIYNKAGLKEESDAFFQIYLWDLKNKKEAVSDKIDLLTEYGRPIDIDDRPDQIEAQLKAAEDLLPQTISSSSYKSALSEIIQGYSYIDAQKSLQLLENHEKQQLRDCFIPAIAPPILTGIMSFYPGTGLLLSGAYVVTRRMGLL